MSAALLWLLAGGEAPEPKPANPVEALLNVEQDSVQYALKLRDPEPSGLRLRLRRDRQDEDDQVVVKVAPWPLAVGGGVKLGGRF